jgi:hypothetical protein
MTSRWLLSLVIGFALAAPAPAWAQKHGKQLFDMQKVEVPARAATASAPKPSTPAGPQLTWEVIANRKAEYIQKIVDAQIAQLRRLIKLSSPDDPQLPDFWFRLGELYVEKYRFYEHRARSLDEPIFRAEHESGATPATEQRKQQSEQDQAGQSLQSAVSDLVVAARYRGYPRMDEVLYRLGYLPQQAGHAGQARSG